MIADGVLKICVKCSDMFSSTYERKGDYVELNIDVATGRIINWVAPTDKQLLNQLNK